METENLTAKIISLDDMEITNQLLNAAEFKEVLRFSSVNNYNSDRALYLQGFEFGEVGFERKSDWMRFVNKLNGYDTTPIKRLITGDKKSLDWGGMTVSRTDITYSEDGFQVDFDEPIQLLIETIGEKAVVVEVNSLKGEITWEWLHYRKGHEELENYAGICEVYIHNVEIIK